MGPFEGHRAWRIACPKEGRLRAVIADYVWHGPVLTVPDTDWATIHTGGGFHSHRDPMMNYQYVHNTLLASRSAYYYVQDFVTVPQDVVLGTVRHYGLVAEYEHGFRSSQVLVTSLSVPRVWDEGFRKLLADRYQCEVSQYDVVPNPQAQREEYILFGQANPHTLAFQGNIATPQQASMNPLSFAKLLGFGKGK